MTDECKMKRIDELCSHVWVVRTFLKHSEEAEEDEELCEVHRDLYDFMLALGPAIQEQDVSKYLKMAKKKLKRLKRASKLFEEITVFIRDCLWWVAARREPDLLQRADLL